MRNKRLIVLGASLVAGALLTWVIIYANIQVLPLIELGPLSVGPISIGFGTTAEHFAYSNVALLFLSIFSIAGIWLDYFLDTQILKS
jgi:hypothetical protein